MFGKYPMYISCPPPKVGPCKVSARTALLGLVTLNRRASVVTLKPGTFRLRLKMNADESFL